MQLQLPTGTILATALGLVAAFIVVMSLNGAPIFGSDRIALYVLLAVGFGMCVASGVGAPAGSTPPTGPTAFIAGAAGILSVVVVISVLAGWTPVLDPFAGVVFGSTSTAVVDKLGVVLVGVLIAIGWIVATVRQIGLLSAAAT